MADSPDNAALLAQISQLFAASQSSNSTAQKQANAQAIKQLQLQLASNEKVASGNNQTSQQIAAGNNQSAAQIAAANNASAAAISAANNASQAGISAANNAASITQAQVTGTTQGKIAEMEAQARAALQHEQNQAESDRQSADIAARLQIDDNDQTQAMARVQAQLGVDRETLAQNLLISNNTIAFNRDQLAANVKTEADKLAQAKDEMEKVGIPTMLANKWYQEQQVALAQSAQQIDKMKVGVDQGRLGFDVFSKAVDLASDPAARYKLGDFLTGVANNPDAKNWFAQTAGNSAAGGFGAAAGGFGTPATAGQGAISPEQAMGNFYSMMGVKTPGADAPPPLQGQGGAAAAGGTAMAAPSGAVSAISPQLQAYLDQQNKELGQIGTIRDAGAGALAPGTLEAMSKDDLAAFQGGLAKIGTDPTNWMRDYSLTRPGQASPDAIAA